MNRRILSFIISLLLLGCSVRLLSAYVVQLYFVSGDSMAPTYTSGQPVLIQKWGLPDCLNRGDVIIIHREDLHRDIVKRIVALPGDTVQIIDGILYVNAVLEENPYHLPAMKDAGNAASPITLGAGEYFVLGDNRNASIDSRFDEVGIILSDHIIGKVID